jgi:hypothetical protein
VLNTETLYEEYVEDHATGRTCITSFQIYTVMLYHAAMVFMMVEINPRTQTEIFAVAVLFVVSAIGNAMIFGQFAVLIEVWGRKAQEF